MKKLLLLCLMSAGAVYNSYAQQHILVSNPTNLSRQELISIPYAKFQQHFSLDTLFTVKDASGNTLPHQIERLGGQTPVNVLVQVAVAPKERVTLTVAEGTPTAVVPNTYARYVPERFDDFAWENDVVAFRMYGKALEGRKDDAQGMDYWAKRTDQLIINKWYKTDDYHKDHGEGMDYYSVGQTLGAGDVALYFNDEVKYTKHYRRYQVLDNGPLRTTFRLEFDPEEVEGQQISLSKTISLDAGSHFNKIALHFNNSSNKATPIAIGIVKRKEENPLLTVGKGNNSLAYWEPEINASGRTGVAVIVPNQKVRYNNNRPEQALLISSAKSGNDFVYYNGAAWDRAGKITNAEAWNKVVEEYKNKLKKPLKVVLK